MIPASYGVVDRPEQALDVTETVTRMVARGRLRFQVSDQALRTQLTSSATKVLEIEWRQGTSPADVRVFEEGDEVSLP